MADSVLLANKSCNPLAARAYEVVLIGTREVKNVKCLITNKITYLPITHDLQGIDSLIFTSRYAIQSLLESANPLSPHYNPHLAKWHKIPSFVISPKSAEILYQHNAKVEFVGQKAHGQEFAKEIIPLLQNRFPLYLRAKEIVSQLNATLINAKVPLQEAIAYVNTPLTLEQNLKPKPQSVLIFTAPSAYKSFVANFSWEKEYIAIAIGKSTFASFSSTLQAYISPKPSIPHAIEFAKSIALELNTQNARK